MFVNCLMVPRAAKTVWGVHERASHSHRVRTGNGHRRFEGWLDVSVQSFCTCKVGGTPIVQPSLKARGTVSTRVWAEEKEDSLDVDLLDSIRRATQAVAVLVFDAIAPDQRQTHTARTCFSTTRSSLTHPSKPTATATATATASRTSPTGPTPRRPLDSIRRRPRILHQLVPAQRRHRHAITITMERPGSVVILVQHPDRTRWEQTFVAQIKGASVSAQAEVLDAPEDESGWLVGPGRVVRVFLDKGDEGGGTLV